MREKTTRTKEDQKLLVRIMASSAFSLFLAGVLVWLLGFDNNLAKHIVELKTQLELQNQTIANLARLKQEQQRALALEKRLQFIVPDTNRLLTVSSELEDIADTFALDQNFAFGQESAATPQEPKAVGVNLSLGGALLSFLSYLKEMERLPYVLTFSQIEVNFTGVEYQINTAGKIYTR